MAVEPVVTERKMKRNVAIEDLPGPRILTGIYANFGFKLAGLIFGKHWFNWETQARLKPQDVAIEPVVTDGEEKKTPNTNHHCDDLCSGLC